MEITIPPDNLVGKYETEVKPILIALVLLYKYAQTEIENQNQHFLET
jgi:hypothetical protein